MKQDEQYMVNREQDQEIMNDQCDTDSSADYAQAETKRIQNQTQDEWLAEYNKRDQEINANKE